MVMKEYFAPNRVIAKKIITIIQNNNGFNIKVIEQNNTFTISCIFPSRAVAILATTYINKLG